MNLALVSEKIVPDVCIDVGANVGGWYQEAKAYWPNAKYLLIDANQACQSALEQLGVDYSITVLSDKEKTVTFYTRKDAPTCTGASCYLEKTEFYREDNRIGQSVQSRTLDEVCSDLILQGKKVLLKLDAQGSELDILQGGTVVLNHAQAVIMEVSFVEYNEGAPLCNQVDAFMLDKGFVAVGNLGDIVHPLNRNVIQQDVLYVRK